MAQYTLYWSPLTSSFAPHAVLEEIGVDYELKWVDYKAKEHKSESFRKINPNGWLPVLLLESGKIMYESAAIVMYLTDRHPEAGIAPLVCDPDRHLYNQWLFYMSIQLYQSYSHCFYGRRFSIEPTDALAIRDRGAEDLVKYWQVIDDALQDRPWLIGDRFSTCDIYMLMLTKWHIPRGLDVPNLSPALYDNFFERFQNITHTVAEVLKRPAVKKILDLYPSSGYASLVEC